MMRTVTRPTLPGPISVTVISCRTRRWVSANSARLGVLQEHHPPAIEGNGLWMTDERPTVMRYLEHAASQRPGRIAAVQDGGGVTS
jgi:hypothetical protein